MAVWVPLDTKISSLIDRAKRNAHLSDLEKVTKQPETDLEHPWEIVPKKPKKSFNYGKSTEISKYFNEFSPEIGKHTYEEVMIEPNIISADEHEIPVMHNQTQSTPSSHNNSLPKKDQMWSPIPTSS